MAKPSVGSLDRYSGLISRMIYLIVALIVYRVGVHITIPGIDASSLLSMIEGQRSQSGIAAMINLFSGGAFERMSIFMLGVMPYITAAIIMQMLTAVSPYFEQIKKEGQSGQRKITQYTRYMTIGFSTVQGIAYSIAIVNGSFTGGIKVVLADPAFFVLLSTLTLVTGSIFLMWLGEQITERGVGNGISMLIFASILMGVPSSMGYLIEMARVEGGITWFLPLILLGVILLVVGFIVFVERGQRRITINYARRQQGRMMSLGGQQSHLPLKLNVSGVIPPIFGSAFLSFVYTISDALRNINVEYLSPEVLASLGFMDKLQHSFALFFNKMGVMGVRYFSPGQPAYLILFAVLIIFFTFFYTAIQFNSKDTSENLKRQGGFIPGIRPGIHTSEYFDKVLSRITFWGAIYITGICLLPELINGIFDLNMYLGGTSILIAVVVVMDLISQLQAQLMSQQYESLMKKANISGALGGNPPSF